MSKRGEESKVQTSESGPRSSLMQSLAKNAGGCAAASQQVETADTLFQRWQLLLEQWQPICETSAARRSRRIWRRRALELVIESRGIPTELRRKVWCTVLEAAVEHEIGDKTTGSVSPRNGPKIVQNEDTTQEKEEESNSVSPRLFVQQNRKKDEPRWARPRRTDDGRISPRLVPREIALDVPRTFGSRDSAEERYSMYPCLHKEEIIDSTRIFEEIRLRRLLTHFARTSPGVQYFQGMNFLGGTLLRVFDTGENYFFANKKAINGEMAKEKQICLTHEAVHDDLSIQLNIQNKNQQKSPIQNTSPYITERTTTIDAATASAFKGLMALVTPLYVPDFLGLRELVDVATSLLPKVAPKLSTVLAQEGLDLMPVLAPWCLTLFASTAMDYECLILCWDFFILGTPSRREELLLGGIDDIEDNVALNTSNIIPENTFNQHDTDQDDPVFSETSSDAAGNENNSRSASATKPSKKTGIIATVRDRARRRSKAIFSIAATTQADDDGDLHNYDKDEIPPPPPTSSGSSSQQYATPQSQIQKSAVPITSTIVQSLQSKRQKNKISSISERHSVLLRLCLVMLRLGERATWETDDTENAKEIDDLHALSKLLEAAQPSPVCASEHSPSSGPHAKRANSAYCFPADPNILCNLFTKTKIDSRLVRAISKRFQKEYEESHQVPPTNNSPEHDAVDDDSPRPTRNSLTNTFNKTNYVANPTIFDSQPGEKRPSFVMRLFRTLRYPLRAIAMRRSKAPFVRTESKSLTHTADSRPSNDPERNTV